MKIIPEPIGPECCRGTCIEKLEKEQQEYRLIGSQRRVPGHTLFSYNRVTGEIKPARITREVSMDVMSGAPIYRTRVTVEKDCYYDQALNVKNFVKRLKRERLL